MKRVYITILAILAAAGSFAQDKKWTLNECMQYAIEHSPKTNTQQAQNSIYHQNYLEAIGAMLPSVNASTNVNFGFGRAKDENTGGYGDLNSFNNNYELYASLTIFDGLANISRLKMQRVNKLMGKQQLQDAQDIAAYDTMSAFFTVLYNTDLLSLAKQQLEESTNNLRQVKRMEELGVKGFPDVAEMQAKEAEDNYNLTKQKNLLTISLIMLKEKMNFPIDEDLVIEEAQHSDLITKAEDTAIKIFEQAKSYNPKALAIEANLKAQKMNYRMAKGNLLPRISLNAGVSTNFFRYMGQDYASFKNQLKNKRGEYVGVTLSIPLFSGFSRSSQYKRSKAQVYIAEVQKDETMHALYREIEQAVTDANGQVDEFYQAQKQKDAMAVAHKVNQKKYEEGLVSAIELHTSANRLLKAKAEELNAKFKYQLKSKLVDYYKGIPYVAMD